MAESTLSLAYTGIREAIAHYLGYGRNATTSDGLTTAQNNDVNAYFDQGYREFLMSYNWSFLKPVVSITAWATETGTESGSSGTTFTASSTGPFVESMIGHTIVMDTSSNEYVISDVTDTENVTITTSFDAGDAGDTFTITANGAYRMDEDFGGILGPIIFPNNEGTYSPIEIRNQGDVQHMLQSTTSTGRPTVAALRPLKLGSTGDDGQRWDMLLWRIPDQNYTLHFRKLVLPDQIGSGEYPYGGMLHSDTVKAFCLAAAESDKDRTIGVQAQKRDRLLAQSIKLDARASSAESLGLITERSDLRGSFGEPIRRVSHTVTVQGQLP